MIELRADRRRIPDLLVVGGGAWGTWIALAARRLGADVLLVNPTPPGTAPATSNDHSRIIRHSHGTDDLLVGWAIRSHRAWRELAATTGTEIFVETGVAWLVSDDGAWERDSEPRLRAAGVPVERLEPAEAARRWPAMRIDGVRSVLLEPTAGFLRAAAGVRAAAAAFVAEGGEIRHATARAASEGSAIDEDGRPLRAGATVWAAGPWLPRLLPALVGPGAEAEIAPVRHDVVYFDAPGHGIGEIPTWIDGGLGTWGIPDYGGRGAKVGPEAAEAPGFDPDHWPGAADDRAIGAARRGGGARFPALATAPVRESRACQYERTASGHYVLDRHPEHPGVFVAGGGSGHGYKQAPAVGDLVARTLLGADPPALPDRRFALVGRAAGPETPMGGTIASGED